MFKQFQLYITLALILAALTGGWITRGWYEDSQEKEVIEQEITIFNEQNQKDADALLTAQIDLEEYKDRIEKLKGKAYEINKGICDTADSHVKFNSLYDETVSQANENTPSKI